MTEQNQKQIELTAISHRKLEIVAEDRNISKEQFLEQIIDCIEINYDTNEIILNPARLEEFKFDRSVLEIIKEYLTKCYRQIM